MRAKRKKTTAVPFRGIAFLAAIAFAAAGLLIAQDAAPTQPAPTTQPASAAATKQQADDAAGFKEFTVRVQDYLTLHKAVEKKLPR